MTNLDTIQVIVSGRTFKLYDKCHVYHKGRPTNGIIQEISVQRNNYALILVRIESGKEIWYKSDYVVI